MSADKTMVYTIYAGMIPTLGFEKGDFTVGRSGNIGASKVRGKSLSLGTSISERGRQRKARIIGSVAWYEYSTTVRAIHEEVLGGDEQGSDAHNVLRWPTNWKTMFESGNKGLAEKFASRMDPEILSPTGEEYAGKKKQPSEQETSLYGVNIESPDDDLERESGRLVNRANSVDIYVTGRDGHIYRLDVTSMGMDTSRAHHGLGSLQGRKDAGVDSKSLMKDINSGNIANAEANLLEYFQGRTAEYNRVIRGLKSHIHELAGGRSNWLSNLNLENTKALERIQSQLKQNLNSSSTSGSPMSELRPNLRTAIQRLERQGITSASSKGTEAGFKSAIGFALHALGTVVQSRNTVTEYRVTAPNAPIPYTIGVQHKMHPNGQQVLEFMALKQADVRIRNEAALENHYLRKELQRANVENIEEVLRKNAIDRNYMDSAAMAMGDNNAVEVGAVTAAATTGIARSAHSLHLGAQVIMSDRKFNDSIDNWIRTVGSGQGWKKRVHSFLSSHIKKGPMIQQKGRQPNERNMFAQTAAPIGSDMTSLNTFNIMSTNQWLSIPEMGIEVTPDANYGGYGTIPGYPQDRRTRTSIATDLLGGALGAAGASQAQKLMSSSDKGLQLMGMQMGSGALSESRTARPGTLVGKSRKYWGLGEYLSDDQRSGYDDNVNPHWWAAPYISLYYPSGQVGSR